MGTKRNKAIPAVKSTARRSRATKHVATVRKRKTDAPMRKVFHAQELWGALPAMGKWAFPLLKELRDE